MRGTVLLLLLALLGPAASHAHDGATPLERSVKAAFLYKFASYVRWPPASFPTSDTPVRIGVIGEDQLADELRDLVAGRTIEGRGISVYKIEDIDPSAGIHILFIGREETSRLDDLVRLANSRSILLVSESEDGALSRGSAINFVLREGRVRFEISLPSAERSGIELSSRLLSVAQSVQTETTRSP
jgi:hypothetical protein